MEKDSNGQLSEDTQATDLELLETGVPVGDRASVHSIVTPSSSLEDPEHPPYLQLKAFVIVLSLFCFVWVSGALTILSPLGLPYEEMAFSVLYAFFITTLGIFVVFFYCFSRNDVRAIWFTLKPIVRSRNVMDVQPAPPVITSRSSVSSSMGLKPQTPLDTHGEPPKPNFVDLYRRQYHSQSVMAVEPNAFYNPHQSIVARKFFKKQRRKQNGLGARRSGDGATPISPDTSELFHPKVMNGDVTMSGDSELGGRPLERLVIGAERNEPAMNDSVKYASVVSECCSCMVSEAHSATDCTRDITSEHSSRSSHLYATVAPDMSPVRSNNKHSRLMFDHKNEMVRMKMAPYQDSKGANEEKHETCL